MTPDKIDLLRKEMDKLYAAAREESAKLERPSQLSKQIEAMVAKRAHREELSAPMIQRPSLAASVSENLHTLISEFDQSLDQNQEVGLSLAHFGERVVFRVDEIQYCDPWLIVFLGRNDVGERVRLIQHATQVDFLLHAEARDKLAKPKGPIGFHYCRFAETDGNKESHATPIPPGPGGVAERK
jgi:hypothetical protein